MIRAFLITIVIAGFSTPSPAASPAAPPAAPASRPAAASQPAAANAASPQVLHAQAIDAMRSGELNTAFQLMEKAFNGTPAAQRTRPLVLNRAILDLTQRVYVMRAVRELQQYLRDHPAPDEQAHDILGAALNVAADNPRVKQGPIWQAAYREWERRNDQITEARPGYRRWGPHWLDNQQYETLQNDRGQLQKAIDDQQLRVTAAANRVDALKYQQGALAANAAADRERAWGDLSEQRMHNDQRRQHEQSVRNYEQQKRRWDQFQQQQQQQRQQAQQPRAPHTQPPAPPAPSAPPEAQAPQQPQAQRPQTPVPLSPTGSSPRPPGARTPNGPSPWGDQSGTFGSESSEAARIGGELVVAQRELQTERDRLNELARSLAAIRPAWPATFTPIDPAALSPPPPPPPDPKAIAALLEQSAKEAERVKSPFAESGGLKRPANGDPPAAGPPAAGAPAAPGAPAVPGAPAGSPTTAPAAAQVPFGPRSLDSPAR